MLCNAPTLQRTVRLLDWSHASPETRHAMFCLAYRMLDKGETKRTANPVVAETLGLSVSRVQKLGKRYIRVTTQEIEGHE